MFTPYRRPDAPVVPAPLFDPDAVLVEAARIVDAAADAAALIDPLFGVVPFWRLFEDPIYLETVRDLGVPGLDEPATPGDVIAGDVVEVDEPVVDDAPPTRALRLAPDPDACPDCGALDPNPCRPKSDPVHGRALTRQHRRRRALAEAGRGEFALVLLVLAVVVGIAVSVGGFLSSALGPVEGPLCAVPTSAGCPDGPRP